MRTAVVLLLVAGCTGEVAPNKRLPKPPQVPVIGGQHETGYPAVGYLTIDGQPGCGASLIRGNVAVTAAHCIEGGQNFAIGFGDVGSGPTYSGRAYTNPSWNQEYEHDVAVLILDQTPPVQPASIGQAVQGDIVKYVGYGRTTPGGPEVQDGYTWERKSAQQQITQVLQYGVYTKGVDGGLCHGDSGGPLINAAGELLAVVHGPLPGAPDYCDDMDEVSFASLSAEQAWIDQMATQCASDPNCGGGAGGGAGGGPGGGGACQYNCSDYGMSPGDCDQGWECTGTCIEFTNCGAGGAGGGGQCQYYCQDYGYAPGDCYMGWYCDGICLQPGC